jgi:hypothetical protein
MGPWAIQVEYTGTSCTTSPATCAVLFANGDLGSGSLAKFGIQGLKIEGMWFYGGNSNVFDGVLLRNVNRSRFDSVYAWGVTNCGIHTVGAVTDTFIQPRVSVADAALLGIQSSAHTTPGMGICLDGNPSAPAGAEDTTSGRVIDPGMEGVTEYGIYVLSADQETIEGGTSEQNQYGIVINSTTTGVNAGISNKFNKFDTIDLEAKSHAGAGEDLTDNGQNNTFFNILAASTAGSPSVQLSSTGEDYWLGGFLRTGVAGQINGVPSYGYKVLGTCAQAGAVQEYVTGTSVWVPCCLIAP